MDVWSGRPATCVRASPPLAIETGDNFALTFFESKEQAPPPPPKQEHQFSVESASSGGAVGKAATPCKVCGDKASGYHYGVTSCEGCKGFFRRSIQKQIEYRCLRDGKCLVIRLNRNRCQFCRFKKCLAVGMSRDSVRYGRVPKRPREPASADSAPEPAKLPAAGSAAPLPTVEEMETDTTNYDISRELVKLVTIAHRSTNTYTEDARANTQHRAIVLRVEDSENEASGGEEAASSTTDSETDVRSLLWHNMALRMTPAVQQVVEFAKRIPGFHTLPQDDQLILIKLGFFEIWLTRITRLSSHDRIVFDDGTVFTVQHLAITYDMHFAAAMLTYTWNIIKMQITEEEMALFTSMLLLCPSRTGLTDIERISNLNRSLNDALQSCMLTHSGPEAVAIARARYDAFATARSEVGVLGIRHGLYLAWCRDHWPRLQLPALFSEIFDIPKPEEDYSVEEDVSQATAMTVAIASPAPQAPQASPAPPTLQAPQTAQAPQEPRSSQTAQASQSSQGSEVPQHG